MIQNNQFYKDYISVLVYKKDNKISSRITRIFDNPEYFDNECGLRRILLNEKQICFIIKHKYRSINM